MNRMPAAIFIIDINKEHIAVKESAKLGIRSFAVTDTNTNPSLVNYPIPGNDDASKAISHIVDVVSKAISEGLSERSEEQDKSIRKTKESKKNS